MTSQGWGPPRPEPAQNGPAPIMQVTSHDEGRNAVVSLYPDRIERVKARAMLSLSNARQDTEIIPIRAISSVQAKKHGLRTNVTVYASGNTVEFRIAHQEAQRFKDAVMQLVLAGPPTTSPPAGDDVADLIRKLGELRDQGLLTDDEFNAKKRKLLDL
jgi:Short C-terminal domain